MVTLPLVVNKHFGFGMMMDSRPMPHAELGQLLQTTLLLEHLAFYGASAVDSDPLAGTNFLEITPTGVLSLNQGQIKFPATEVASADANTLDDYEEGTFSPTIIGTTTAGTATYTQQNGRYTKIGRLVQFEIFIVYSAGTGTGNMDISGLPFTIGGSSYPSFTIGAFDDITLSADNYVLCWGLVGTNQMRLAQMITGGGTQTQVAYDAAGAIQITGTYSV
jgi:hypothetical protein